MAKSRTVALRNAMADHDLHPGDIIWDGNLHRFPGHAPKGRPDWGICAWYRAFPDRKAASFGDFFADFTIHWKAADQASEPAK